VKSADRDPALDALIAKISGARGVGCSSYKESCLRRRLAVRMRARGVHTYEQYAAVLDGDTAEYERLLDALTINVSKLFRNREMWDALAAAVLPALWDESGGRVRGWSAGCASGEEPYTLAILLLEIARRRGGRPDGIRIDATDFDRASLARAADGVYPDAAFEEAPAELVARYFTAAPPRRVGPDVRPHVRFLRHDLLREAPPAPPYDLIMCRNVVIYFDRPTQDRLFLSFVDALRPGGYLVLGKVEILFGGARERLVLENPRERIYRRP
jgi:chemotaxis methyl-accepting protein methylase